MKTTTKLLSLLLALLLCLTAVALSACGEEAGGKEQKSSDVNSEKNTDEAEPKTVEDISKVTTAGKLVVGITEYAPMDFKDDNGEWTGFDAEFARLFAEKLGINAEFIVIEWDNKLLELDAGSIDCIWNGMTITEEITGHCAVSDPYVKNQQVVVMKADRVDSYKDTDSMKELKFAAEAGSAGQTAIADNIEGADCTAVSAQSDALLEVESGSVDACVIDATMAAAMTGEGTSYADLKVALELSNEEYGVAFRADSDLCKAFNDFKKELTENGKLKELADKYCLNLVD